MWRSAHLKRALGAIDFHAWNDGVEIERRRDAVIQFHFSQGLIFCEILVHAGEHGIELCIGELHSGHGGGGAQHFFGDGARLLLFELGPQNAGKKCRSEAEAGEIGEKRATVGQDIGCGLRWRLLLHARLQESGASIAKSCGSVVWGRCRFRAASSYERVAVQRASRIIEYKQLAAWGGPAPFVCPRYSL